MHILIVNTATIRLVLSFQKLDNYSALSEDTEKIGIRKQYLVQGLFMMYDKDKQCCLNDPAFIYSTTTYIQFVFQITSKFTLNNTHIHSIPAFIGYFPSFSVIWSPCLGCHSIHGHRRRCRHKDSLVATKRKEEVVSTQRYTLLCRKSNSE